MAQKIILFLSELRPGAREQIYRCPDGTEVRGTQTNEAPVKYLLRTYPAVTEILCIVTPEAGETAWPGFQELAAKEAPGAALRSVEFQENQDFSGGPLSEIMSAVKKGDEILLETTGGFRNAVMDLLLLSRVLSYKGIATACAVYSNFKTGQVEDVSRLIGMFELVGGMQELTRFGSVRTLRSYYAAQPAEKQDEKINKLLTAMEKMKEAVALCRTQLIDSCIEDFNRALRDAADCDDPLMRTLLPVFRSKFGKRLTTRGLIKWCVESDMLQQALTIYKERIPSYILRNRWKDILAVLPGAPAPEKKAYEDRDEARFHRQLLFLWSAKNDLPPQEAVRNEPISTLQHFEELWPNSYFIPKCPIPQLKRIVMDYVYIQTIRNMINHANVQETGSQKKIMNYLSEYGYKRPETLSAEELAQIILESLEHMQTNSKKGEPQ